MHLDIHAFICVGKSHSFLQHQHGHMDAISSLWKKNSRWEVESLHEEGTKHYSNWDFDFEQIG